MTYGGKIYTHYADSGADERGATHPKRAPRSPSAVFGLGRSLDQTPTRRQQKAQSEFGGGLG